MIKTNVHIETEGGDFMDANVFVEVCFPYLPRVGDTVHLSNESDALLEKMALIYEDGRRNYFEYIHPHTGLAFCDCIKVKAVLFKEGESFAHIELGR